jgi:hypothetical protein
MGPVGWVTGRVCGGNSERRDLGARVIGRRAVLLTTGAVIAASRDSAAALPVPPGNTLAFRLLRHGSEIGRHTLTFDRQGDTLTVHIAVDALVTVLSIPFVRYTHRVVEVWQGGALASVTGETDKNGQHEWVSARRGSDGLVVLGSKTGRYIAPEPAGSTSYWNKRLLDGPMISLEDGVLLRPKVVEEHVENIPLASGGTIPADRYNLSGAFKVDLWYDRTGTWASLGLPAADGSYVHYERL